MRKLHGIITDEIFTQAIRNWEIYVGSKEWGEEIVRNTFFKFIKLDPPPLNYKKIDSEHWIFPSNAIPRLHMLASPHFRTLIKAIECQK